jgi:CheY-like chemotaxis protein
MTTLLTPVSVSDAGVDAEVLSCGRQVLSGKRIALIGFPPDMALELTRVIDAADGFARCLSPEQAQPASDVLKPFELILVHAESVAGTGWLEPDALAHVGGRTIAVSQFPVLLRLAAQKSPAFGEYWPWPAPPRELLLRCVLALGGAARMGRRSALPEGSTVVLADDDASVTGLVRRALERNGMTCQIAATGGEALALITKLKPCAVVLDVHMPDLDGFEVLSRVKSVRELAQTKVIMLTAQEHESDVIRGFSLGADDYVCKPFNPMELTIRLMRVIGRI